MRKTSTRPLWLSMSAALALAAAAVPAAPAAAAPRDHLRHCFLTSQINNWRAAGDRTVYVRVDLHRVFRMRLMGSCPGVDWAQRVGIKATPGPDICSGIDATIISPGPTGPRRCPVTSIQELTPAEIAALPKKDLP